MYLATSHGFSPNLKAVRIATGLPRSFLYLGKDGILFKRYLRHDPYSLVTLRDIARSGLWKLFAFDLFCACLLYELLRRSQSVWPLLFLFAGAAPVIFFAVVIFEPGSPERYLPALPFLVLAIAWVLRDFPASRRVSQFVIAAFLVCVVLTNCYSFAAPRVSAENGSFLARVADLRSRITSSGVAMVTTNQDELEETINCLVFDNINRPSPVPFFDIVSPGSAQVLTWRQDLAARVL